MITQIRRGARQIDANEVPRPGSLLIAIVAAALRRDAVNDRKAETRALADFLCREKWLQAFREHLLAHARAGIRYREPDVISGRQAGWAVRIVGR